MNIDLAGAGLGVRSKRYVMVVDDGKIVMEDVEKSPGEYFQDSADLFRCIVTNAQSLLAKMQ